MNRLPAYLSSLDTKQCVRLWAVCLLAVVAIYSMSLTLTKHIWQDEVQIIEMGRVALPHADKSYSMIWKFDQHSSLQVPYYLGPVLQDAMCRLFGEHALLGPRISSLLGAVLASAALLGWLLSRGSVPFVSLFCSVLLFLDPLFVESYRGARVDSWSIAFMLLALWVISVGRKQMPSRWGFATWEITGGIAMACAALFWVSAVLLVPLVVYEALRVDPAGYRTSLSTRVVGLFWLGFFGALALSIMLTPVLGSLSEMLGDSSGLAADRLGSGISLVGLVAPYVRSPWLPVCAVVSMVVGRYWGLAAATAVAVGGVLTTGAYVHRAIYLLPYLLVAIAGGASFLWTKSSLPRCTKLLVFGALLAMLAWSSAVSVGARTFVALSEGQARDATRLQIMLEDSVGFGPYRAYVAPFELYYAARGLGWRTYRTIEGTYDCSDVGNKAALASMDIVICRADEPEGLSDGLMKSLGFSRRKISTGLGPAQKMENYGEYLVYQR